MLNDSKGASDDALPSKEGPLGRVMSTSEAQITDANVEDNRNGEFQRSFSPRQIISLGSNIGSGVFIATGKALANGGPGNMVVAYGLVCSCVWAVLQTLSEMTIAFPTSGNYIDYAGRWVDPALAFGAGFAEWLGWTAVVGAEAVFFNILVKYWSADGLPLAASLTIFTVATLAIFLLPNKAFAWFEYVTSLIKIFLFIIIIFLSIALVAGAGPTGQVHDGSYWRDLPVFKNGFFGFATCSLLAVWAVGDQVFIGIMGGEAESPRYSMAHATKLVPFRVNIIYMLSVIFVTLLIPSNDDRLLGGSGVYWFTISESVYLASRVLRTMAHQKLIPEVIALVDSQGRPVWSLVITGATALLLTYLNLNGGGAEVFNWLLSITSASFFMNWIIIAFTSWRFHQALVAQNDQLFSQVYAWKSVAWPVAPIWLMSVSILLLACCIGAGIGDLSVAPFSAYNFFQYVIGILIIVVFTAGYKIIMKTPWRDPKTADLVTGRRILTEAEITQLDDYYAMPKWRRFLTYVALW
ncbi:hypothetical protein G7Z17_g167 [Cylindrodendrum hubeiense]|uniref:Amino acid permease/ SLC12A domain-containing protein n=1 Tax=Cylindrodendrum hubeiense TaxID=595255 RepID=A0A9P5HLS1_9HYPO|nr:hypothetical protein G7Z17_g167 [Cylindrodendrum hubeiense]